LNSKFTGDYHEYFNSNSNFEALSFLMLANYLIKSKNPNLITFAEEFTGYPTLCRPCHEGGVGFDFRLIMGIPDLWVKLLKNSKIEDWNMNDIVSAHCNRRKDERGIVYTECHDQALVGDKTIAFWLMDKDMYSSMSKTSGEKSLTVDNGIAFLKLIKLFTISCGGDGYLNFIGNEFGHPEWLDFPREGNNFSFHYARRLFHLANDKNLYYYDLNNFDGAMIKTAKKYEWMHKMNEFLCINNGDKVVALKKDKLLFVFNFNIHQSFVDYKISVPSLQKYEIIFSTDDKEFGGHQRINKGLKLISEKELNMENVKFSLKLYLPSKSAYIMLSGQK